MHPLPTYAGLVPQLPPQPEARRPGRESRVLLFFGLVRPYKGLRVLLPAPPKPSLDEGSGSGGG